MLSMKGSSYFILLLAPLSYTRLMTSAALELPLHLVEAYAPAESPDDDFLHICNRKESRRRRQEVLEAHFAQYPRDDRSISFLAGTAELPKGKVVAVDEELGRGSIFNKLAHAVFHKQKIFCTYDLFVRLMKKHEEGIYFFKSKGISNPHEDVVVEKDPSPGIEKVYMGSNVPKFKDTGIGYYKDNAVCGLEKTHRGRVLLGILFNLKDWYFYDTNKGYVYMAPCSDTTDFVNKEAFTSIDNPLFYAERDPSSDWIHSIQGFFRQDRVAGVSFFFNAHSSQNQDIKCGLTEKNLKKVLEGVASLRPSAIALASCYLPVSYVVQLFGGHAPFNMVTEIDTKTVSKTCFPELQHYRQGKAPALVPESYGSNLCSILPVLANLRLQSSGQSGRTAQGYHEAIRDVADVYRKVWQTKWGVSQRLGIILTD